MLVAEWVARARTAILELLDQEHAAPWLEVEAKIADKTWATERRPIQPHHLTSARQELRDRDHIIVDETATTRGGAAVTLVRLADLRRRRKAFERAAMRKRLLMTRYIRWAVRQNLLGPAGERATHASLLEVAPSVGYRLERPGGGDVVRLLGHELPGSLDDAAYLQLQDDRGVPTGVVVTVPIEVKNVREWIYPDSERLHQLLHKAAWLQEREPDVPIVPLLVCRRGAYRTFTMAKAFGFYVADAKSQFVPRREDIHPRDVEDLARELGFTDLVQDVGPHRLFLKHFGVALPRIAASAADNWRARGATWGWYYERLRKPDLGRTERRAMADDLDQAVREYLGEEEPAAASEEHSQEPEPDLPWDY